MKFKIDRPKIILMLILLMTAAIIIVSRNNSNKNEDVKVVSNSIYSLANEYKAKYNVYGIISGDLKKYNCFSGNTFVKDPAVSAVIASTEYDDMTCVFSLASGTPILEHWSISFIKYDGENKATVRCVDSTGASLETPGLTTESKCKLD